MHMAKLFGSSGVRGLVNVDLTPQLACKVGLAVAAYAKAKKTVVACDTRVSGGMLAGGVGFRFAVLWLRRLFSRGSFLRPL